MWPIQLPYGLSEHHRCFQTSGGLPVIQYGAFPRWQVFTLEQLATVALATPPASTPFHSTPLQILRDNDNMVSSESVLRDPMAKAQAERKMPKPQLRHSDNQEQHVYSSPGATTQERRKTSKPQPRPLNSPGQHSGNSLEARAQKKHKMPRPQSQSFKSLMKQHVHSSPRATSQQKYKTPKPQSRPFNSLNQNVRSSVKREKKRNRRENTPSRRPLGPSTQPGNHERLPIVLESDEEATSHTVFADDDVELKLGDISDFELRKKTAHLLTIAPGLPVADLYHLLMEKEGRFEAAEEDIVRKSQTPFILTSLPVREKTMPPADPVLEDEDVKVKIDFDDEFFIYDAECPDTQLPDLRRPKQRSRPKKAKKGLQKAAPKPRKGFATKKSTKETGEYTGDINRGVRETSHDREFIASDDEAPLDDSDPDYSDSDRTAATDTSSSECDTEMEVREEPVYASSVSAESTSAMDTDDDEDPEIDMQPEYAYNPDVLASPNPG